MTTNIERAVEVMGEQWENYDREDPSTDPEWDREMAKRLADAGLLITDEMRGLLNAAEGVCMLRYPTMSRQIALNRLRDAYDAYLASKEQS